MGGGNQNNGAAAMPGDANAQHMDEDEALARAMAESMGVQQEESNVQ